jgi:hypothetical protein
MGEAGRAGTAGELGGALRGSTRAPSPAHHLQFIIWTNLKDRLASPPATKGASLTCSSSRYAN